MSDEYAFDAEHRLYDAVMRLLWEEFEPQPAQSAMLRTLARVAGYVLGAFPSFPEGAFDEVAERLRGLIATHARMTREELTEMERAERPPQ